MHGTNHDDRKAQRIISVVPSQTELLYDLGLDDEVVGITKFCIHPEHWFRNKKRVGGTKNLNLALIDALQPTLILANREENQKEQIEYLQDRYPLYLSDVVSVNDALSMIQTIGQLTGTTEQASSIVQTIQTQRQEYPLVANKRKVLYLIWYDPWMAAGQETFINSMLYEGGFSNCVGRHRYPVLQDHEIRELDPDLIFLSSEPYPFKTKHIEHLAKICPDIPVLMVDGELFSWYGSRMSRSFEYFSALHESLR